MNIKKNNKDGTPPKGNHLLPNAQEVTNNKDLLRRVFDYSISGIMVVTAVRNKNGELIDLEYILANDIAKKYLEKDLVGKRYLQLYPGEKGSGELERYGRAIETGESIDFERLYIEEGVSSWFRTTAVKLEDGLVIGFEDITARKKAEEEIRKQTSILQQSEELAMAGSWEYDVKTNQFIWSEGMYRHFDIPKETRVAPSIYSDYAVKEDRQKAEKLIANICENFQPFEEILRIKVDGRIKTIATKSVPLKNNEGQVEKMLGVDMDVTQSKQAEEKIFEFNRILVAKNKELASLNSEIKTFNSIAANDYKETLRQLYLSLEFIASNDAGNLSNSGRANVRRAQSAVQRMKLLTDDLVSYSKLQEVGVWEARVDLNAILKDVIHDFDKRSLLVDSHIDCKPLPFISGYPFLISLVFHHLIENAIRFKKETEMPLVKIYCEESIAGSTLKHEMARPDIIYHAISFKDNGIGFPGNEAEKIFDVFYRIDSKSRHKGSGIGLAICRKIMDMHEGFIIAESEPSIGSAFHCYFPFEARENPPS